MIEKGFEKRFLGELLSPGEIALARQLFAKEPDPEEIKLAAEGLDLDTLNIVNQLALARLSYKADKSLLPTAIVPRVRGLHRYYLAQMAFRVVWLEKKIALLAEKGIPVLLLKGMAMYAYFDAGHPRIMADADIAVPEEHFAEAKRIMLESGLEPSHTVESLHSIDLKQGDPEDKRNYYELDLHHRVFKRNNDKGTDVWARTREISFRGVKARVLSPVDMLLSIVDNETRNIFNNEAPEKRLKWLIDMRTLLLREDMPPLKEIAARAEQLKEGYRVRLLMKLFLACFPDVFPEAEVDEVFPDTADYRRWFETELKYREYFLDDGLRAQQTRSIRQLPRLMKMLWLDYRRQKLDICPNAWNTFYGYLKWHYRVDGFGTLVKNTFRRLRI